MLSKKDVTLFVERMQEDAEKAVKEKYYEARKIEEERIISESGAEEQIKNMQRLMNKLSKENSKLNDLLEEAKGIKYSSNYYDGLTRRISDMENVKNYVKKHMEFESPELTRLKKKYEETQRSVTANYEAVKAEVKNKTNAKRALEYIKELGFDVSSLEQMSNSEIAIQLDKKYLFVNFGK